MKEEHIKMLLQAKDRARKSSVLQPPAKPKANDTTRIGQPEIKPKPQPTMRQIMAAWSIEDWRNAK